MTTPAHVLKVLAAACDPDLPDPMPCPVSITLVPDPCLSMQFGLDEVEAVRAWARLMHLPELTVRAMPAGPDPAHASTLASAWGDNDPPLWAGCRQITVFCPLSTLPGAVVVGGAA